MQKDKIHYQSIDYKFPKRLWIAAVWLKADDGELVPYFLNLVKNTKQEAIEYGKETIERFRADKKPVEVADFIILMPLTFSDLFPLKKEYWENPYVTESDLKRTVSFCKAIARPNYYRIMIAPTEYLNRPKEVFLTAAFVFGNDDEKYLEEIIKASHHPASGQYKNSAIYNIGESFSYNLVTKKVFVNANSLPN